MSNLKGFLAPSIESKSGYMVTMTGRKLYYRNPTPESIHIEDIAAGLANCCRYSGQMHPSNFYSTGLHSIRLSYRVPDEYRLYALLHDASEAYTGDAATPHKDLLGTSWTDIENDLTRAVYRKYDLYAPDVGDPVPEVVKAADTELFYVEVNELFGRAGYWGFVPKREVPAPDSSMGGSRLWVYQRFIERFHELAA